MTRPPLPNLAYYIARGRSRRARAQSTQHECRSGRAVIFVGVNDVDNFHWRREVQSHREYMSIPTCLPP